MSLPLAPCGKRSPGAHRKRDDQPAGCATSSATIAEASARRELRTTDEPARLGPMPKSEVRLTLHGGEILTIADQDVLRVCENLFRLGAEPDAVVVAAVLIAESRHPSLLLPLELTASQSAVIRKAAAMPDAA